MTEKEIKQLLEKYQKGLCSEPEKRHVEDFLESYQYGNGKWSNWKHGEGVEIEERIFSNVQRKIFPDTEDQGASISLRPILKFAAVVVILITSIYVGIQLTEIDPEVAFITKTTQRGQKSNVVLSDGTTISLNSESTLIFPEQFKDGKREITLIGEAFFQVTRNPAMPFIVHSGDLTTTVLGTSFNIKAFPNNDISVSVAKGMVRVEANPIKDNNTNTGTIILEPNQQAVYTIANHEMSQKSININSYMAWKDGVIKFDQVTFEEAALILERWFNIRIDFENDQLKTCLIRSEYKNENLINILESLKFIQGIDYRFVENNRIIISGEGCNTNPS